ncbi:MULTISPECIES: P22 phage major capsid protein family protein [unclassified Streptomyces]|uniref:P22 phage major capsid protein family protein n=1 Tax=unclassified Streptomyces TaxID=2593676 RepID=UPI001488B46C|nr:MULTISPECIES: P22 phage major capsid protein family protein [unclassified Streptomyces]
MANTLLTPDVIAQQALANLYETTVMANLVHRDYEAEFARRVGDTITIRKPAVFTAQEYDRSQGITVQDAVETGIPLTLNHFADVSFAVTAEDLTLKIEDFDEQLLTPAMEAISQKIDRDLLTLRNDITQEVGVVAGDNEYEWDNPRSLIEAGRVLDTAKVPMTERRVAVGPTIASKWLADPLFHEADKRGNTEGLTEANLGRRTFGFDPYMTQNIAKPAQTSGNSTTEVGVAFHRTAFALAFRPLQLPRGNPNAAIANYKGFGLRVIYGYDMDKKQDVVSVDCLYGVKTLDANRACLIKGADVP